ncbi:MAG: 4Fe-4S binding protein [Coriobacteriales bacterium]|jgi:anaerobic dimethyl sulfoxide reductase subunit B (iron-sulfur subunit)|nr:4Fe-4S binding protein [Coriobacteriales bacterium]
MRNALLVDYEYCTGCHTCEIACQQERGLAPDEFGIEIKEIGPYQLNERKWQLDYIPVPTERCNRCLTRTQNGKDPSCVKHCQAGCLSYGPAAVLADKIDHAKMVLFG